MATLKTNLFQPIRFKFVFSDNQIRICGIVVKSIIGSLGHYEDLR